MKRRAGVLAVMLALALLICFSVSAASRSSGYWAASATLDPSINMSFGHIDYANKDRIDYFKVGVRGTGLTDAKLKLVGLSKYLTIVRSRTTPYKVLSGKIYWETHHVGKTMPPVNKPTFMIALKVRASVPMHKLQCVLVTIETTGVETEAGPAWHAPPSLMGGKKGACWTGKQWLTPIVR